MINKKLAADILNIALSTGGDFAEIFYENYISKTISMRNGDVDNAGNSQSSGIGLRIYKNLQSVYGHTNDISKKGLIDLANKLSKSFNSKQTISVKNFQLQHYKKVNKNITSYNKINDDEIISLLNHVYLNIKNYDKRITRVSCGFNYNIQDIVIFNSNEKMYKDHREHGRLFMTSIASYEGKIETRFDGPGTQKGFEYFTKELDINELSKNHAEKLILMLEAKECPSGKFPVVIGNGWGGVIFHESCGHQLEATSVAYDLSVFSNKIGEQIANPIVSAYDNGTIPNEWGSNNIDDEGNACQNTLLIDKGILKNYLVDTFNARRMKGFKPNGCARRQSYKYEPTSRMSNTYIANGKSTKEEIIKNTKLGIYAVSFNGGSVNPSTGEFNFGCSEAYLIKDGEIKMPLRGATLIGKATEILKHIDMVGNDLDLGVGVCGSSSGSIPVTVGQPTIRIDEITVGGRGGDINEL